jgi:hypothetical protein
MSRRPGPGGKFVPECNASAGQQLGAMAVPPAAIMARLSADLSMIAPEAIRVTLRNLFEPKPGQSGPAFLLVLSRRGSDFPAVFLNVQVSPPRELP